MNAQALDENFNLVTRLIGFQKDSDHSAEGISLATTAILNEFRVQRLLSGVVGDATSAMVNGLENITQKNLHHTQGPPFSHLCFPHVLQRSLVVSFNKEKTVSSTIQSTKEFVNFVQHSPKFLEFMKNFELEVDIDGKIIKRVFLRKPKAAVSTR